MIVAHLTASTFFGGPERQMLGLAEHLPAAWPSVFVSFREGDRCRTFLEEGRARSHRAFALANDTPHLFAATRELTELLSRESVQALCCHGYKANLVGRVAARRLGIPAVAVSRGWTGENFKVYCYESIDRFHLPWMDHVVCVSEAQAEKVLRVGVAQKQVSVIRNAIDPRRFSKPAPDARQKLLAHFPHPPKLIVGAIGRLSPEKGFGVLVEAARDFLLNNSDIGVIHFGDGALQGELQHAINNYGLSRRFVLAGMNERLDPLLHALDLLVLPSFSEGLPNVVLEACASGVAVVATAVGGTPEIVSDGKNGYLVPPGNPAQLARRIQDILAHPERRADMGTVGRTIVSDRFSFTAQARQYERLLTRLAAPTLGLVSFAASESRALAG